MTHVARLRLMVAVIAATALVTGVQVHDHLPGTHAESSIYVYEHPAVDWSRLVDCYRHEHGVSPWRDEEREHAQNMAEVWVHQALLRHPRRTHDPESASLFYIPLYVAVSSNAEPHLGSLSCSGQTHQGRLEEALDYLEFESTYFMQYGGANHFFVCGWWRCGVALGNRARVVLSRTILGINESPPANTDWARWECPNRVVTVPYVSSTHISESLFVFDDEYTSRERKIPFFFAGTNRDRVERENLAAITTISPTSVIGVSQWDWKDNPETYANHISDSQYCLCPRGDTMSSRRLFDAVAAGCIPVLTHNQAGDGSVPFADTVDYSEFTVLLPDDSFMTLEKVTGVAKALVEIEKVELLAKRVALLEARGRLIYGFSSGDSFDEMVFHWGTIDELLLAVGQLVTPAKLWECIPTPWWMFPAERVFTALPPAPDDEADWVVGSETVVLREEQLLVCTPPYTGSRPIRNVLKQVQHASTWEVKNYIDGLDILRIESEELFEIYAKVGWVKIAMSRDPVTRLLTAYLHRNSPAVADDFKAFVSALSAGDFGNIPPAFWPQTSSCGIQHVTFESVLMYEDQNRSVNLLESLPNRIWEKHARNFVGTGNAVFDGRRNDQFNLGFVDLGVEGKNQCGKWSSFYDSETLDAVVSIYRQDYQMYKWYNIDVWKARVDACLQ